MRTAVLAGTLSVLAAIASAWVGRGSMFHFLGAFAALGIGLWSLALAVVFTLVKQKSIGRPFFWTAGVCLGLVIGLVGGLPLFELDVRQSKSFYEAHVPALERWKEVHGAYPADLAMLGLDLGEPPIKPGQFSYSIGPDGEWFRFDVPGRILSGYQYDSEDGAWKWYD